MHCQWTVRLCVDLVVTLDHAGCVLFVHCCSLLWHGIRRRGTFHSLGLSLLPEAAGSFT